MAEFREASLRGEYHGDFVVNSKDSMESSRGTEVWIGECERLFDRSIAESERRTDGGLKSSSR